MNKKMVAIGKLRKAQLITTFAPGAIVDMPEFSVIIASPEYWNKDSPEIREPRLEKLLKVDYFKEPYSTETEFPNGNPDIPCFRFPQVHYCLKCGRLTKAKYNEKECICKGKLIPSRFICACINGHLEDFPYGWWVHEGSSQCNKIENLRIRFENNAGGLSGIVIKCEVCGKTRTMQGCMSKDALINYRCYGHRPWLGQNKEGQCGAPMRTLQRGASNVYFSITQSALTIPSSENCPNIEKCGQTIECLMDNKATDDTLKEVLQANCSIAENEIELCLEKIKSINKDDGEIYDDDDYTEHRLYEDEYMALRSGHWQNHEQIRPESFIAEETAVPHVLEGYIDSVMLVKRLREVVAVKGFRRITPEKNSDDDTEIIGETEEEKSESAEMVSEKEYEILFKEKRNWLPAIEMKGEGLFIRFNEDKLKEWEDKNGDRYKELIERLGDANIGKGMVSPRYVLLHTFSHLLIRQLALDCGYSGSALKERIYSSYPKSEISMAGVLIYTSSSDSDGSLGGLVRQGKADFLETTIRNMLQEASWCSSDPICSDSRGQGLNSLNYAACHACALLPETSCEARNCLLDRIAVAGKYDDRSIGYFGKILMEG